MYKESIVEMYLLLCNPESFQNLYAIGFELQRPNPGFNAQQLVIPLVKHFWYYIIAFWDVFVYFVTRDFIWGRKPTWPLRCNDLMILSNTCHLPTKSKHDLSISSLQQR